MYVLEYTTNQAIMEKFGPRYAVSLLKMQPLSIETILDSYVEGKCISFRNQEGNGFRIHPLQAFRQRGKIVYITSHGTYIFRECIA